VLQSIDCANIAELVGKYEFMVASVPNIFAAQSIAIHMR